ncbi:PPM-type phosphatase domain containing protein [Parasponia andersonii]|uniref:Protein phosphatase n=1 Tax=Parasponia andersonii TaxID=3476 RepID=A0A2P5AVF9_PARAD|nr:PPM-type phosphatase domain containing protein [Parasponia andersonii]
MPSPYFPRLRAAVQRSIVGNDAGLQDSVKVFIGKGKLLFGNSQLFSRSLSSLSDLEALLRPHNVVAAGSDSQLVNQRKNLSVVGALSRTLSIPSVSGPSLQVCGYHIGCVISDPNQFSVSSKLYKTMAVSGSRVLFGECYINNLTSRREHRLPVIDSACVIYSSRNRSFDSCLKATMSLKNREKPNNSAIYGYFIYEVGKRSFGSYPIIGSGSREFHSSSSACFSAGPARDVSFDNSSREEQLSSSTDSSEQNVKPEKALKLVSASCYLPHPDKEETGGEDAHFICVDEQAIGVADGVGGWADHGVDAGLYSRELMSNSVTAVQEEPKGFIDPARVLEKAHSSTKAKGSSTACIIALNEQGIHAINLGDSGFMVVRDGCTIFRSPVQQHDFNFTFQLESGSNGDLPSSGQVFTVPVAPGDVIIAGTDGLFDNLYNNEITAVVVHTMRAGLGPQATAQKIAALARQRAQDKDRQTPFSTAAQDAGFRYYGGKLDDITVVISYVTGSSDK